METTSKKSISPTMKVLKDNGFVKITFKLGVGPRGLQEWFPSKGDFSVSRSDRNFTLEVGDREKFELIKYCLEDNGIDFEESYDTLITINY